MKKIISVCIIICISISFLFGIGINTSAVTASGKCGRNLTWNLNNGVLTISGTGSMDEYGCADWEKVPWYSYREDIEKIIIDEGVTSVGMNMFRGFSSLTEVSLPDTLRVISKRAFQSCTSLEYIEIPSNVTLINHLAFLYDQKILIIVVPESVTTIGDAVFAGDDNLTIVCATNSATENYAKDHNIKYSSDSSIASDLQAYKQTLIDTEQYYIGAEELNIKYSLNTDKKKLSFYWDEVDGAYKYRILIYKNNEYIPIGYVDKSECTIKNIKSKQKYSILIEAITEEGIITDSFSIYTK